jgi:hypothetical protein
LIEIQIIMPKIEYVDFFVQPSTSLPAAARGWLDTPEEKARK